MTTKIEKRLAELKQQRESLVANLNALAGAIQVLEQLLEPEPSPLNKE